MRKPVEIEFKYPAESLEQFHDFCRKKDGLLRFTMASGFDHFYAGKHAPAAFCRHRQGPDMNQLTLKRKTTGENNYVRTEHNIELQPDMTEPQIRSLCTDLGYDYTGRLFKTCFIYKYKYYTLVYYLVYNDEMKEQGRYFEIEMAEDADWRDDQEAYQELLVMEKICKPLGAAPEKRLKESLFEMFGKAK